MHRCSSRKGGEKQPKHVELELEFVGVTVPDLDLQYLGFHTQEGPGFSVAQCSLSRETSVRLAECQLPTLRKT